MSSRCRASLAVLAVLALACAEQPAARQTYDAEPVRAAIVEDCGPELVDSDGRACVQIDVIAEGEGEGAAPGEWLKIHYIVLLPDGTQLDTSHDRKPLSVRLGHSSEVIEGMHRGLDGMRVGERRRFWVPPKLGYRGRKLPGIPPDANLTFLAELMERRESL